MKKSRCTTLIAWPKGSRQFETRTGRQIVG